MQAGAGSAGRRGLFKIVLCRQQAGNVSAEGRPDASEAFKEALQHVC